MVISGTGVTGTIVRGAAPAARNVISGNGLVNNRNGVDLINGTTGNIVSGNCIGTQSDGAFALGNGRAGVSMIDGSSNTIGGTASGAANVIAFNGGNGVEVVTVFSLASRSRILSNSIYSNGGLGIDLSSDGATANDADTGSNDLQNFPVLTSAINSGGKTFISGGFNSTPNKAFVVQFFGSPAAGSFGFGEGKTYLGQTSVTTAVNDNASLRYTAAIVAQVGQVVTATATSPSGDTSEFSRAVKMVANSAPTISALRPVPGSKISDKTPLIGAKVTDKQTNLSKSNIKLYVDGKRITRFSYKRSTDRLSYISQELGSRRHAVKIVATDAQGLNATKTWRFTIK